MNKVQCCIFLIWFTITCIFCEPEIPYNPCPERFRYYSEGDEWYGNVTLPTPSSSPAVLKISFSIEDIHITDYGNIEFYKPVNILDHLINRDPFVYKIKLPISNYLPRVTSIEFKDNILCTGEDVDPPSANFWLQHTYRWSFTQTIYQPEEPEEVPTSKPVIILKPSRILVGTREPVTTLKPYRIPVTKPITTWKPAIQPTIFRNLDECGKIRTTRATGDIVPLIYRGTPVARNAHPWLVALYEEKNGKPLTFFCGGNLISNKHALTAAHCVVSKKKVQVKIGAHNNKQAFEIGAFMRTAQSIIPHPDYISNSAHADIAILVLSEVLEFSNTIKPICMWNDENSLNSIVGVRGTIMGWGLNERGETTPTPVQTEVAVVSQQDCQRIETLESAISNMTFCAGTKGTGPCMGDSGGGMYLIRDGRWYLRGIISVSVGNQRLQTCDVDTFSVYADTAQFLTWVINYIR